jgi:hypothetical protein
MEYSWHGYLFGAEQAWNADADRRSFTARFARLFLRDGRPELARAIDALGDVTHTAVDGYYQSIWQHLFFAERDSDLFRPRQRNGWTARGGRIRRTAIVLDARLGRAAQRRLRDIRRVFAAALRSRQADPRGVLPYWLFAVDTLAHAARKLAVLGPGGRPTAAARKRLRMEMETLRRRFERLWLARNRRSEIRLTLARYRRATRSLRDG